MAVSAGPANIDTRLASTLDKRVAEKSEDNIFGMFATFKWLEMNHRVFEKSGTQIRQPILYGKGNSKFFSKWEVLPARPMDPLTDAAYERWQAESEIVLNKFDISENQGNDVQLLNYAEEIVSVAELTLRDTLQVAWVGTAPPAPALNMPSIHELFDPDGYSIGGISPTTNTWWAGQGDTVATMITNDAGLDAIDHHYNLCGNRGSGPPDTSITTQAAFEAFSKRYRTLVRYGNEEMLRLGFDVVQYKRMNIFYEPDMIQITGRDPWYLINSKYLKLWVDPGWHFTRTPDRTPDKQPQVFLSYIIFRAAIGVSRRDCHSQLLFTALT